MNLDIAVPDSKSAANAARLLVLGLGNDLLTDDAVGLKVASELRHILEHDTTVAVVETSEMGLGLLEFMTGFEVLVIVDAIETRQVPPGFIHEFEIGDFKRLTTTAPHFLGIAEVLALGRAVGLAVPARIKIFAIEVEDPFTLGTHMTAVLSANLPQVVEHVRGFCESVCRGLAIRD